MRIRLIALSIALQLMMFPALVCAQSTADIDFTEDGQVDFLDFVAFAIGFGEADPEMDLDRNGRVDFLDFVAFAFAFGKSNEPPKEIVTYEVTFDAEWSAQTHPDFPALDDPHFSDPVGGTHNSEVVFWEVGGLATRAIKSMAEFGTTGGLLIEIKAAIKAGTAEFWRVGRELSPSPGSQRLTFEISETHPLVTLVTMIAPSPDWFVGVAGLSLFSEGAWLDKVVVELWAYDSGTDSGASYTAEDLETKPPRPIFKIQSSPFGPGAPRLGTFTFVKQ